MENPLSDFSKLLNSQEELDTKINMFCECRDYRETPLFKKIINCDTPTKYKLVKCLFDAADIYSSSYNKFPSIEIFKTLDIILEVLELSGVSIITKMKKNKVTSKKEFTSDVQKLPTNIFNLDKSDDDHLKNTEFTGFDYAKAISNYYKDKTWYYVEDLIKPTIEKIAKGLIAEELFIIYFVLAILGPCYKIPFRDLAYNPPEDIILPLIKDSLPYNWSVDRDNSDRQCQAWLFVVFNFPDPLYESILEARDRLNIYGQMLNAKTFKEYSCYKDEYYNGEYFKYEYHRDDDDW